MSYAHQLAHVGHERAWLQQAQQRLVRCGICSLFERSAVRRLLSIDARLAINLCAARRKLHKRLDEVNIYRPHYRALLGLLALLLLTQVVCVGSLLHWLRENEVQRASQRLRSAASALAVELGKSAMAIAVSPEKLAASFGNLSEVLRADASRSASLLYMASPGNHTIAWSSAPKGLQRRLMKEVPAGIKSATSPAMTADGRHLLAMAPLALPAVRDAYIVLAQPVSSVLAHFEPVRSAVLWSAIPACLVFTLGGLVLAIRLFQPFTSVVRAAHELAKHMQVEPRGSERSKTKRSINLAAALQQVVYEAQHDPLTGLCNRVVLPERIARCIARHERYGGKFALIFIDLNGFKTVNDKYGHNVGDEVLQVVAARMASAVRPSDTVARMGGDEFLLVLDEVDGTTADSIARKIAGIVADPVPTARGDMQVGMSWGVAEFPRDGQTAVQLITFADSRMYDAKFRTRRQHAVAARAESEPTGVISIGTYEAAKLCARLARHLHLAHRLQKNAAYQAANAMLVTQQQRAQAARRSSTLRGTPRNAGVHMLPRR